MEIRSVYLAVTLGIWLSGCSSVQQSGAPEPEHSAYQNAIFDAAVIESSEIMPVPVIEREQVKVVTWTLYPDSYRVGRDITLAWGDVWVTLDQDVQNRCKNFAREELVEDLQKLLGLPLDTGKQRSFVTLQVDAGDLFRPCANPSIREATCSRDFPTGVSQQHAAWYAHQTALSYQLEPGFPWTRLGYTYNWKQGASEVGAAEFVVRKGATAMTLAIQDTPSYCSR